MTLIDQNDELIDSITLHNRKPAVLHGYFAPFLIVQLAWILYWLLCNDFWQFYEFALIGISIITVSQIICCCSCFWSVHVRTFLMYRKALNPIVASFAKVVPVPNNGETEIVPLRKNKDNDKTIIFLTFQSIKYIYDADRNLFKPLRFPIDRPLGSYLSHRGFLDENSLTEAQQLFGRNIQTMFIPKTFELFVERATAPFFIFQMFCSFLWMFDTFFYFTLFTIFMLIMFEFTVVKQQIRSMSDILKMGNKPYNIHVQRNRRWKQCSTTELIPGDIVSITRSTNDNMVPCDILLLKGSCIIDESLLTGESVPQMKESIEDCDRTAHLDVENHSKINVVFGGTKVVQTAATGSIKSPDNGCVGYVLRTGFYTTQGKLLRTILYGVKRMTANNLESFCFIMFLLVFAIAAAAYVWIKGSLDPTRSRYKLFFECVLIITSVVPPELPIQLSLAVNSSLISLAKLAITCTEPFRLPFAGKVEICCFDKTGTLTSDDLIVEGVIGAGTAPAHKQSNEMIAMDSLPTETAQVLGACHSLAVLDGKIIGDPLEKAILASLKWTLVGTDMVKPNRSKIQSLKIVHRYHFTSALKRMTVIASSHPVASAVTVSTSDLNYIVVVKGAAEILAPMFHNRPANYEQMYLSYSRKGARVLALGYRDLGVRSSAEIRGLIAQRAELESQLKFVGFAVISCPLKPDSYAIVQEICRSSHKVLMITGDNALTACHVAKVLEFAKLELMTLVEHPKCGWVWQSVYDDDTGEQWPLGKSRESRTFHKTYDLCVDGKALDYLRNEDFAYLTTIMPYVSVFARCAPKQKEFIVLTLKSLGFVTLMCGDGTNDVGALKHAHVGVAILTSNPNAHVRPIAENMFGELETLKLGDASIAAPFSSRRSSIKCVTQIIKQGRCTLVTTLQMFKIIALNSLISAYSNSVLFLDNIKLNDSQATFQAFLLCICLLCVSKSQPLKTLSKQRPLPTIFNLYTISTVFLQFINHFLCLIYLVHEASIRSVDFNNSTMTDGNASTTVAPAIIEAVTTAVMNGTSAETATEDAAAEIPPNIINSTVYVISMMLQISNFAVNYRGHPFMQSLRENTMLLCSLLITAASVFAVVFGLLPDLTEMLGLIDFPSEFQNILLLVLILNYVLSFVIDYVCLWLFGEGKLTIIK